MNNTILLTTMVAMKARMKINMLRMSHLLIPGTRQWKDSHQVVWLSLMAPHGRGHEDGAGDII